MHRMWNSILNFLKENDTRCNLTVQPHLITDYLFKKSINMYI